MTAFGIPSSITTSIITLFISTPIQVNVNNHITPMHFNQRSGLLQGLLILNIALDPLIRPIQQQFTSIGLDLENEAPFPPYLSKSGLT